MSDKKRTARQHTGTCVLHNLNLWNHMRYGETEQMKRQRRQNTFPKTVPNDTMNEYGGRSEFIRRIRADVFN